MRLTLIRSATVIIEIAGKRILVDPMLDDVGARPAIEQTRNPVANPTVPLPFPAEEVVRGIDAVIVTHRHRDHLDSRGEALVPRDVPVFCQPEDE
jgi:L-ascorbate metabolism protein UlaG (beta-lactamase superfamily)